LPRATLTVEPEGPGFTGESVTLKCKIDTHGGWTYQWSKRSKQGEWTAVSPSEYRTVNEDTLIISGGAVINGDQYRCRGYKQDRPTSSQYSNTVTLTVGGLTVLVHRGHTDQPEVIIKKSPGQTQVFTGETVTLQCKTERGEESGWSYLWYKNGQPVDSKRKREYRFKVTADANAEFSCRTWKGSDPDNTQHRLSVKLSVSDLPRATLTVEPEGPGFTGESVTLKCKIDTHDGWTYQWIKKSKQGKWTAVSPSEYDTVNEDTLIISGGAVINGDQYRCRGYKQDRPTSSQYSNTVTLTVGAYGVGAVLSHRMPDGSESPLGFVSRTLSPTEKKYSQLDKEALAIIFGIKKFHKYLYGRTFTVCTDHKRLITLFGEKKSIPQMGSPRVQRWAILLSAYEYQIVYRPGKFHSNADALSRLPLPESPEEEKETEQVLMIDCVDAVPVDSKQIRSWTAKDPLLSQVHGYVLRGWPTVVEPQLSPSLQRQWELSARDGCVLWGARVVVPQQGREMLLKSLHQTHSGISRMKGWARSYMWWPGMDKDVEKTVQSCDQCQSHQKAPPTAPLHPWEWPESPWSRIHVDYAGPFMGRMFLVIMDAHSKWLDAYPLKSSTSQITIEKLRQSFSVFGLPQVLVSDNGPCFTSTEFETFMKQNGIRHVKSAPFHPSTNGLAERAVQTLKVGLKKAKGETIETKLSRFLFSYRITPHATTGVSPAELLRSTFDLLLPDLQTKMRSKQLKQKENRDGQTKLRHFTRGDKVLARNYGCGPKWIPAVVEDCTGPLSYSVVLGNGHSWKRHVDQLRGRISGDNQELMESPVGIPASVQETVQVSVPTSSENCDDSSAQQAEPEVTLAKPDPPCTQSVTTHHSGRERRLTVLVHRGHTDQPEVIIKESPGQTQVFTGETVTLQCKTEGGDDWGWSYLWYKNGNPLSSEWNSEYTVKVTADANAEFICRTWKESDPDNTLHRLSVKLSVSDLPRATLTVDPESPLFTGESVTLKCKIDTHGGWTYQWIKKSKQGEWTAVSPSEYDTVNEDTLIIRGGALLNGDQYCCRGYKQDRPTSSQYSNTVTLTVGGLTVLVHRGHTDQPQVIIKESPGQTQVFTGETVTLQCKTEGGEESGWSYLWYKNGQPVDSKRKSEYRFEVTADANAEFSCRTWKGSDPDNTQHRLSVRLSVSDPPRATLTVDPESPLFTGESVTLQCEIQSYSNWRYQWYKGSSETAVYHSQTNTYTIRSADQDQYWCRGERDDRPTSSQNSRTVTLTVKAEKPKPELTSSHKGAAALIGNPVVLNCKVQSSGWKFYWSKHTQNPENETETETPSYTISSASVSDRGEYRCRAGRGDPVYYTNHSDALWITVTGPEVPGTERERLAIMAMWGYLHSLLFHHANRSPSTGLQQVALWDATSSLKSSKSSSMSVFFSGGDQSPSVYLMVSPSRTQHFTTGSLSLSCEGQSDSTGWTVSRHTHSEKKVSDCSSGWGSVTGSTCNISSLSTSHTGVYWCESESGGSSDPVNITVHNGSVILESPVHPVPEGGPLTLRCSYRHTKPSNLTAEFYKDGSLLQTQTPGEMTIRTVSKSDEGLYHCKHPEGEQSPQSWISVRGSSFSVSRLLSSLLAASPYLLVSIILVVKCCRARAKPDELNTLALLSTLKSWDGSKTSRHQQREAEISLTISIRAFLKLNNDQTHVWLTVLVHRGHTDQPEVIIKEPPGQTQVFTGETVTLQCKTEGGDDWGWGYYWYKNGQMNYEWKSEYTFEVTADSNAEFECGTWKESERYNTQFSAPVRLSVSDPPRATLTVEPKWSPLFTGESVTLKCEIQSYSNWRYQWYKGSSRTAVYQSQTNTFTIRSAADQDQYWCRGERDDRPTSSQNSSPVTLTVKGGFNSGASFSVLSSLLAASPYLLVSIILVVKCCRARAKPDELNT
ncbi:hypothetical protein NFI96_005277, partial [Prochilodus magdalenae]